MDRPPRIFVVDPVCVLTHGHNPQSLLYFANYFQRRGCEAIPVAGRLFRLDSGKYKSFLRAFGFYYQRFMEFEAAAGNADPEQGRMQHMLAVLSASSGVQAEDEYLELTALSDWVELFLDQKISANDALLMPSVDYYGACGLLRLLAARSPDRRPAVHFRFIGVMENARLGKRKPLNRIRDLIRKAGEVRLTLSAETPAYAEHLSRHLGKRVGVTLYPLEARVTPLPEAKPFIVFSAGAGREDKGFLRLLRISRMYLDRHPEHDVLFCIQNLTPKDEVQHAAYCSQLYAQPNVQLIDAEQTDDQMEELFRSASFLILPYESKIYRQRGSAVLMEGVTHGRPLAITANTGFHAIAEGFETLFNVKSDEEFCAAIAKVYATPPDEIHLAAQRDADRYQKLLAGALDQVQPLNSAVS